MKNWKRTMTEIGGTIALAATLITSAAAGEKAGNGGTGYICNGEVLLTDYLEAEDRGIRIEAPRGTASVDEIVEAWLNELAKKDVVRADRYRELAKPMIEDIRAFTGKPMTGKIIRFTHLGNQDTLDGAEQIKPDGRVGCEKKVQIVIQKTPQVPEDRLFRFDVTYWSMMSPLQQALTVMHELVYHEAISLGHKDSFATRYLNSKVTSVDFPSMSACAWRKLLAERSFSFRYRDYLTDAIECDEAGVVRRIQGKNLSSFSSELLFSYDVRFFGPTDEIAYPVFLGGDDKTEVNLHGGSLDLKITYQRVQRDFADGLMTIGYLPQKWMKETECKEIDGRTFAQLRVYSSLTKDSGGVFQYPEMTQKQIDRLARKLTRIKELSYEVSTLCPDGRTPDVLFVNGIQVF